MALSLWLAQLVPVTIDCFLREKRDKNRFVEGKTTTSRSKMHTYGPPIFLPRIQVSRLYLSIRSIVWWEFRQQWLRALPWVFITDFARCTCFPELGMAEERKTDRENRSRRNEGERECEEERFLSLPLSLCLSMWSFINWSLRLHLLCQELITNPRLLLDTYIHSAPYVLLDSFYGFQSAIYLYIMLDQARFLLNSHLRYCVSYLTRIKLEVTDLYERIPELLFISVTCEFVYSKHIHTHTNTYK